MYVVLVEAAVLSQYLDCRVVGRPRVGDEDDVGRRRIGQRVGEQQLQRFAAQDLRSVQSCFVGLGREDASDAQRLRLVLQPDVGGCLLSQLRDRGRGRRGRG